MKFCPKCGAKLVIDESNFCYECGTSLKDIFHYENKEIGDLKINNNIETKVSENNNLKNASCETNDGVQYDSKGSEALGENFDTLEESKCSEDTSDASTVEASEQVNEVESADNESLNYVDSDKLACYEIATSHTKEAFLREAWIQMARDNIPEDVFNTDFSDVVIDDEEVYESALEVELEYSASVGYDREEPYIAYEDYYEKEPYLTTETYYDYNLKEKATRQVTKYKDVKKQRQVTKYKTVTDWSAYSAKGTTSSYVVVSNTKREIDEHLYLKTMVSVVEDASKASFSGVVTAAAETEANEAHRYNFREYVEKSLPGNHSKDIRSHVNDIISSSEAIFKFKKYSTTLNYKGHSYTKYAFPFGNMPIGGDVIENDVSPEKIKLQKGDEVSKQNKSDKEKKDYVVFERTKWLSITTMALILISILISCFLRYPVIVAISFALAIGSYIANSIMYKRNEKSVFEEIEQRILERNEKFKSDMENYDSNYRKRMYEALNKKMVTLGLETVSEDEFAGEEK